MSSGTILVVGFGPFLRVVDNPAAATARGVDGVQLTPTLTITGRVMPVSYVRAPALTSTWIAELSPVAVVGIGVARSRSVITVETLGRNLADGKTPDVDGQRPTVIVEGGPQTAAMSAPAAALAEGVGGVVGADAGRYVCNAWIYAVGVQHNRRLPISFIHIPPSGLAPHILSRALSAIWGGEERVS